MKVGAPLFAIFARGGHDAACGADLDFVSNLTPRSASHPPLQKTQGRGTHIEVMYTKSKAWATLYNRVGVVKRHVGQRRF